MKLQEKIQYIGLGFGSDTYQEYAKELSKSGWYVDIEIRSTRVDRQTEQLCVTYRMVNGTIPKFKSED